MDVFWRHGFEAASVTQIARAAGASRGALYALHGDKLGLFAAAIDAYAAWTRAAVEAVLAEGLAPRAAARALLSVSVRRLADPDAPDGCLRCRATLENGGLDSRVDRAIAEANAGYRAGMVRLLSEGPLGLSPGEAAREADHLTAVLNGIVVLAEAGAAEETLSGIVDTATAGLPT